MNPEPGGIVRSTTVGMRRMLLTASLLVFIVGIQLFILSEHTERFFAWPIQPPTTPSPPASTSVERFPPDAQDPRPRAVVLLTGLELACRPLPL